MLLLIWGQSWDLETGRGWERIEALLAKLRDLGGDRPWTPTPIELRDYCDALNNVQLSAECDRAHNPTDRDVWVVAGGELHRVAAGQTMSLA